MASDTYEKIRGTSFKRMRRNFASVLKFLLISLIIVLITTFLYKSFFMVLNINNDNGSPSILLSRLRGHPSQFRAGAFFSGSPKNVQHLRIDWHDYKFIEYEKQRTGIGEHGEPAYLSKEDERERQAIFNQNGFNGLLSDRISLNRSLPDIRHKDCKNQLYLSELPTVSVIVPFFNEHWSTLLRTCYSVLNRSPSELIVEIILVDDSSTKEFLKAQLDEYVAENLPKVKIVRLKERSGLIVARLAGAKKATGDVLIFLDSHTEPLVNWLPPLLDPIAQNYKVCVCPFIDVVAFDTFEYRAQDEGARGAFDWEFFYKRLPLLPESLRNPTRPFKSPVMAGGLFAISAKFFWELGGYDEGLDIWGGEQYELSFKIWQCGGEMYDAPCSRVGHVYRGGVPFSNPRKTDYLHRNFKRVAEVWMDEYKEYLYLRNPQRYQNLDTGDLTNQLAIREKLKCKPFRWFIEEVAFDLPLKYPFVEPPDFAYGTVRNIGDPSLCVDTLGHGSHGNLGLYPCAEDLVNPQQSQNFALSWHKDIRTRRGSICWDVSTSELNAKVIIYECHGQMGNQYWKYNFTKKWIIHGHHNKCLDCDPHTKSLYVNNCEESNVNMKWDFGYVNETALNRFDEIGVQGY